MLCCGYGDFGCGGGWLVCDLLNVVFLGFVVLLLLILELCGLCCLLSWFGWFCGFAGRTAGWWFCVSVDCGCCFGAGFCSL